jgi:2-polyprenyl-6-methoxyphenol hydroxylase-like FAD-dependent oxidoreductase
MRIAINGIGIAGPTLAYWLRKFGHKPVLFEQSPTLRRGGYVVDFWGLGYEIAERMGIVPELRRDSYEMQTLRMVDARGHTNAKLDLAPIRELLDGRFVSLARADLSAALLGACRGIPAHFGRSIEAIDHIPRGCIARLSDGTSEPFDLVIGADGLHSRIRGLEFQPRRVETALAAYVAAFRTRGYGRREDLAYVSHTVPGQQVARVSLRDDETLVMLVCRADRIGIEPPQHQQKAALRRVFGEMRWEVPDLLDRMDASEDFYFDRVSQIHMRRWWSRRVALVGDAAACPSLLAGEGSGLAMIEAYVLAGELQRHRRDFARAFASYEARLRDFVESKQRAALGFLGFFAPRSVLGLAARNLAVNALSLPFVARSVLARSLRDDIDLPHYLAA